MKNILTLTDFSKLSVDAVDAAFKIAKAYKSKLTIYHNMKEGELMTFELDDDPEIDFIEKNQPSKMTLLNRWTEQGLNNNVKTEYLISAQSFTEEIEDIVERLNIDLIIMGTESEYERADSKWFSNTQSIIKHVNCPVLVIKEPIASAKMKSIVYASSFNENEKPAFRHFLNLFKPKNSLIHLLCINTMNNFSQPTLLVKEAMKDYEKIAKDYNVISTFYRDVNIDSGILNYIKSVNPDMFVISNKIDKPIKHFFKGNHSLWAVARANCPVLTVDYKTQKKETTVLS